jgi:tubulin-specific chaperone D
LLDSVDENLKHPNENIQQAAGAALAALMRSYFPVRETGPSDRLQKRVVDKYTNLVNTSDNPAETRGFTLALGSLPKKLLAPGPQILDSVLACLMAAALPDATVGQHGDAETRRNAIQALMSLTREVGFSESSCPPAVGMSNHQLNQVFESFLCGLQDYNTDRRGDIGSWSRIASMTGLEQLTSLALERNVDIDIGLMTRIYGGFLKQLAEKLDKVRLHAGSCIEKMLKGQLHRESEPLFCNILRESLQVEKDTNWSDAKVTFRRVVKVLNISEFFHDIISGLVVSVGALTESVTKEAENALIEWIRDTDRKATNTKVLELGMSFLAIFHENKRKGRVILPLLKTLEKLSNRGLLDDLLSTRETQFASSLLVCLQNEMRGCVDIHRLLSGVNVALGLLSPLNEMSVNRDVLSFTMEMLGHEFPRVRKHTADSLYVRLLEDPSVLPKEENESAIVELLLQGQWQSDMLSEGSMDQLCAKTALLIGVEFKLSSSRAITRKQAAGPREDDFSSYASLVNATIS